MQPAWLEHPRKGPPKPSKRNVGGAEWQRASVASECWEGERRESVDPERAERARAHLAWLCWLASCGGASEGIGGTRASGASEGLSSCARTCVRGFRARAHGRSSIYRAF